MKALLAATAIAALFASNGVTLKGAIAPKAHVERVDMTPVVPHVAMPMFVFIGGIPTSGAYTIDYINTYLDTVGRTEYTFAASFGAPDTQREIFFHIYVNATSSVDAPSSVTVDGVAATLKSITSASPTTVSVTGFAALGGTAATSGDIVVSFPDNNVVRCAIAVYRVVARPNAGADATDSNSAVSASSGSINLGGVTVQSNGFMLAMCAHANGNDTTASGTLSENYDTEVVSGSRVAFYHLPIQGSQTTPTLNFSWSGSAAVYAGGAAYN